MLRATQKKMWVSGQVKDIWHPNLATIPSTITSANNAYAAAVLADSPVLYCRMEEPSGGACADLSGNGRDLTAHGTFTRGVASSFPVLGSAITLGGTIADYIDRASEAALNITGAITYECWIKVAALPATQWYLMSKGFDGASAAYAIYLNSDGTLQCALFGVGGAGITGGGSVSLNTWHHIVLTRTGATAAFYLDGTAFSTNASGVSGPASNTARFTVGAADNAGTIFKPITGSMDEIAVYNTSLSSVRVAAHYAARI